MRKKSDALSKAWEMINTPIIAADAAMKDERKSKEKEQTSLYRAVKRNARERHARKLAGGLAVKVSSVKENDMSHSGGHPKTTSSGNNAAEKAATHRHISRLLDDLPAGDPVKGIKLTKKTISVKPVAKITKVKKPVTVCDLKKKANNEMNTKKERVQLALLLVKQAAHQKEAFRIGKMLKSVGNRGKALWRGGKEVAEDVGKSIKTTKNKGRGGLPEIHTGKKRLGGAPKIPTPATSKKKVLGKKPVTKKAELLKLANLMAAGRGAARAAGGLAGGLAGGMSGMPMGNMVGTGMGSALGGKLGAGAASGLGAGFNAAKGIGGAGAQAALGAAGGMFPKIGSDISRIKLASDLSQAWFHYSYAPTPGHQKVAARVFVEKIASSDLPYQEKQAILGMLAKALPFAGRMAGGLMRGGGKAVSAVGNALKGPVVSGMSRGGFRGGLGSMAQGAGRGLQAAGKGLAAAAPGAAGGLGRFAQTTMGRGLGAAMGGGMAGLAGYGLGGGFSGGQGGRRRTGRPQSQPEADGYTPPGSTPRRPMDQNRWHEEYYGARPS